MVVRADAALGARGGKAVQGRRRRGARSRVHAAHEAAVGWAARAPRPRAAPASQA